MGQYTSTNKTEDAKQAENQGTKQVAKQDANQVAKQVVEVPDLDDLIERMHSPTDVKSFVYVVTIQSTQTYFYDQSDLTVIGYYDNLTDAVYSAYDLSLQIPKNIFVFKQASGLQSTVIKYENYKAFNKWRDGDLHNDETDVDADDYIPCDTSETLVNQFGQKSSPNELYTNGEQ